ncbi:CRAL-TRIO domain-containing protein [Spinellus fusiger]|nr:CRAL-TRIO domain-containing protein [Spinellus fusiger]
MTASKTQEQQQNAIEELRQALESKSQSMKDEYLVQFLIARSWSVSAAKDQIEKALVWRAENKVDLHPVATKENGLPLLYAVRGYTSIPDGNIEAKSGLSESVLRIYKYMGGSSLHKTDRDGCPLYIEQLGYHEAKNIAKHTTVEEVSNYHIGCNEFLHRVIMDECSKSAGKTINRETVIFDCTGMGWHQFHMPALQYLRSISDTDQKYYPETLNRLFLVNAPSAFVMVWKIVKAWLDPGTIDKIQILGTDYKQQLLTYVTAENLPTFLGGDCTCSHIEGGCVPSQVLKNVPLILPQPDNHQVPTAYTTDIMEQATQPQGQQWRGPMTS